MKGHNGTIGNEEANKLAGEGAKKPYQDPPCELDHPPGLMAEGAEIAKLEQKDFYRILMLLTWSISIRTTSDRAFGRVGSKTAETIKSGNGQR